jgi:hypothetical protein
MTSLRTAIHTIEAFSRRRGVAIDSVVHQRACYQTQFLYLLAGRQLDFLVQLQSERVAHQLVWFRTAARSFPWCHLSAVCDPRNQWQEGHVDGCYDV